MKTKFPFSGRFAIVSFACVAALAIVMGFALSSLLTRAFSEWEWENTATLAQNQVELAGLHDLFITPRAAGAVERWGQEFSRRFRDLPDVVRIKIWDREGTILWADDPRIIGQRFPDNRELRAAFTGRVVGEVKEMTKPEHASEEGQFSVLAEVYVPIFAKGSREVLGVLEIYKIPTRLIATFRWALIVIWTVSLAGGAVLYFVLLLLAKRAREGALPPRESSDDVSTRSANEIRADIEGRFGFFPPFFEPATEAPRVLENLWQQTLLAYASTPLPALFKEKLFAYLSRYCAVPYCIVCHSCVLRPLGMTATEVLSLLESPTPTETDIAEQLAVLVAERAPLTAWPESGSALETALMNCSVLMFLSPDKAEHCQAELRRLLGPLLYSHLTEFLGYVKTCHVWVETHPELAYEADKRAQDHLGPLLAEEPRLRDFFRDYGERVKRERRRREGS